MNSKELYGNILRKRSFLCVGLDSDPSLFPAHLNSYENPIFEFNKAIIDATSQFAVAYKPNLAFYEAEGAKGWEQLEKTVEYIRRKDSSAFIIADAKRGDIGNTAGRYASAFFERMDFDAVTLAPYMGRDSVDPFLKFDNKWAVILALTSNPSATDFETMNIVSDDINTANTPLYRKVIETAMEWGTNDNIMFVAGATRPEKLGEIRQYCPNHFLLVPGVGTQGGTIADVAKYGMNSQCGLLVNISRNIIFAGKGKDFDAVAAEKAKEAACEMASYLNF
ncbi:MAG TPA: orotidine-5'-phosphate decarboxylase [Bacteroidales bacterium]|nr:orotidine-5'-phosphate decarboxylase [Bacteroidales bacterium]